MTTPATHSDTIDLANVARTIRRGWMWVVVCTLLGIGAAMVIITYAPPKFAAKVVLVARVAKERGSILSQLSGLGEEGGVLGGGLKGALETESQLMTSRTALREVVDSLKLQARIVTPRRIAVTPLVANLALQPAFKKSRYTFTKQGAQDYAIEAGEYKSHWDGSGPVKLPMGDVTFTAGAPLPPVFVLELRDPEDAIDRVLTRVSIGKPGGELLHVNYRADDSLSAPLVATTIVETYLRRRKTRDRGVNQERVIFLRIQIDSTSRALAVAEHALKRQQETSGVLDPEVIGKLQLEQGAGLRKELTEYALEEASLRTLVDAVQRGEKSARQLGAFPTFLKASTLNSMIGDLTALETERYRLGTQQTATNQNVLAIDSSMRNIQAQLLPTATTYLAAISQQRRDVEAKLDTIHKALETLPATAEVSLRLQREIANLSKFYAVQQAQLVDARLAALGEGGDVKVSDPAVVPKVPVFPDPIKIMAGGLGGGFIIGVIVAVMFGMMGRWAQDPAELERTTGVPALTFDPLAPLMIGNWGAGTMRTVLVAPLSGAALAGPVVQRLAQTATARSMRVTVLDLSNGYGGGDVNAMITRLEQDHELVVVQLPGLVSDEAAAALRENRPVLLVTPERRVDRSLLAGAVKLLKRLDVPCAGIVMSGGNGRMNGDRRSPAPALPASP